MSNLLKIQQYLTSKGLAFVNASRINVTSNTLLLEVPRDKVHSISSPNYTSKRQLSFISSAISKKFDVHVVITIRDSSSLDDVAAGLRAILKRTFNDVVSDVFVSFPSATNAVVWVEITNIVDRQYQKKLEEFASLNLKNLGIEIDAFEVVYPAQPQPSVVAILRAVKMLAPAPVERILDYLNGRGFICPSVSWLSSKLDGARKRGFIVRSTLGQFSLTSEGLDVVPRSRSSSSSDVERMLALAKRKEW